MMLLHLLTMLCFLLNGSSLNVKFPPLLLDKEMTITEGERKGERERGGGAGGRGEEYQITSSASVGALETKSRSSWLGML